MRVSTVLLFVYHIEKESIMNMNMNKKRSPVWLNFTDEEFSEIIRTSKTQKEAVERCGLVCKGRNYTTMNKRIEHLKLDKSHFEKNYAKMARLNRMSKKSIEEICVENSSFNRGHLKRRLLKEGLIENKCQICGQLPEWKGKPLVLILDHINGVWNDHRRENIRMVCPNCNSQLETNCGKNIK